MFISLDLSTWQFYLSENSAEILLLKSGSFKQIVTSDTQNLALAETQHNTLFIYKHMFNKQPIGSEAWLPAQLMTTYKPSKLGQTDLVFGL